MFLRFGAVGSDEPWFKTEAAPRTATLGASGSTRVIPISRADVKSAKKEFALERKKGKKPMSKRTGEVKSATVDLTVEDEGEVRSPVKDPLTSNKVRLYLGSKRVLNYPWFLFACYLGIIFNPYG